MILSGEIVAEDLKKDSTSQTSFKLSLKNTERDVINVETSVINSDIQIDTSCSENDEESRNIYLNTNDQTAGSSSWSIDSSRSSKTTKAAPSSPYIANLCVVPLESNSNIIGSEATSKITYREKKLTSDYTNTISINNSSRDSLTTPPSESKQDERMKDLLSPTNVRPRTKIHRDLSSRSANKLEGGSPLEKRWLPSPMSSVQSTNSPGLAERCSTDTVPSPHSQMYALGHSTTYDSLRTPFDGCLPPPLNCSYVEPLHSLNEISWASSIEITTRRTSVEADCSQSPRPANPLQRRNPPIPCDDVEDHEEIEQVVDRITKKKHSNQLHVATRVLSIGAVSLVISVIIFGYLVINNDSSHYHGSSGDQIASAISNLLTEINLETADIARDFAVTVSADDFLLAFNTLKNQRSTYLKRLCWLPKLCSVDRENIESVVELEYKFRWEAISRDPLDVKFFNLTGEIRPYNTSFFYPIIYVEPFESNAMLLGFDFGSSEQHLRSIQQTEDSLSAVSISPMSLPSDEGLKDAVLLTTPAVLNNTTVGYVIGDYDITSLVDYAIRDIRENDLEFHIFDEETETLLYSNLAVPLNYANISASSNAQVTSMVLTFQCWKIFVNQKTTPDSSAKIKTPLVVILIIAVLVGGVATAIGIPMMCSFMRNRSKLSTK